MYIHHMKTITINVSEPVYQAFQTYARQHDRTTSELIREAMETYQTEQMQVRATLRNLAPLSLGKVLRPLQADDDVLGEMNHA